MTFLLNAGMPFNFKGCFGNKLEEKEKWEAVERV
jgi:hypothetical protein